MCLATNTNCAYRLPTKQYAQYTACDVLGPQNSETGSSHIILPPHTISQQLSFSKLRDAKRHSVTKISIKRKAPHGKKLQKASTRCTSQFQLRNTLPAKSRNTPKAWFVSSNEESTRTGTGETRRLCSLCMRSVSSVKPCDYCEFFSYASLSMTCARGDYVDNVLYHSWHVSRASVCSDEETVGHL